MLADGAKARKFSKKQFETNGMKDQEAFVGIGRRAVVWAALARCWIAQIDIEVHQIAIFFEHGELRNVQAGILQEVAMVFQVAIEKPLHRLMLNYGTRAQCR